MKKPCPDDEVQPPVCRSEVFENGDPIALLDAQPKASERWVSAVAEKAGANLDWHYDESRGGLALVLHMGDAVSRKRAEQTLAEMKPALKGKLLEVYTLAQPRVATKVTKP